MAEKVRASIDLGTNTCLLLVALWDQDRNQLVRVLGDYATVVRLGEGVDQSHELQPAAIDRVFRCLEDYAGKVREAGVSLGEVVCVATSQARDAKNSGEFFSRIKRQIGFSFRTLSGKDEAHYTFLGTLLPGMDPRTSAVIDIGGGSTEFISFDEDYSIDMGSVRFTERFLKTDPVTDEEFWACQDVVDQELQAVIPWKKRRYNPGPLIAVAGTATTLAAWHLKLEKFDTVKVDGLLLSRGDIHRMVEELKYRTVEERKLLPCMEPMRADVILAGALILWRSLEVLDFGECQVSVRGLRYGILK